MHVYLATKKKIVNEQKEYPKLFFFFFETKTLSHRLEKLDKQDICKDR